MTNKDQKTEQLILQAAESEFLEKGYANAKVVSIAQRAGVSHSMLHYYFRSKEKLFQVVFESKTQKVAASLEDILNQNISFEETIRQFIETQFNFMAENPKLPYFMLTEILTNKQNRDLVFSLLSSRVKVMSTKLITRLNEEIKNGRIKPVAFQNLLLNIVSINVITFIAMPILRDLMSVNDDNIEEILNNRRQSNVEFILNSLRA